MNTFLRTKTQNYFNETRIVFPLIAQYVTNGFKLARVVLKSLYVEFFFLLTMLKTNKISKHTPEIISNIRLAMLKGGNVQTQLSKTNLPSISFTLERKRFHFYFQNTYFHDFISPLFLFCTKISIFELIRRQVHVNLL